MEVKANYKTNVDDLKEPGDFCYGEWSDTARLLCYICPCGKDHHGNNAIRIGTEKTDDKHQWLWDGNQATPTLSPSIKDLGCKWHGYLTKGVWRGEIEK